MKSIQRANIAAIVISLKNNKPIESVYSYELSQYISMSGETSKNSIEAYDYSRNCFISGNCVTSNSYSLYDYGESRHIDLEITGNDFEGYDYGSNSYFSGTISGSSVSFYDYQTGQYYNFS